MTPSTLRLAALGVAAFSTAAAALPPSIQGCQIYPANNVWNTPVDTLPVDPNSGTYVTAMGATSSLHPDWGNVVADYYGIPINVVASSQAKTTVVFDPSAADESDAGPYPIPASPQIEGTPGQDGDRHLLMLDKDNCVLYELYYVWPPNTPAFNPTSDWTAYSGAIFDLKRNDMRPDGFTSADAAGLGILPGLAKYDETAAGEITHAFRMTSSHIQSAYVWPASHLAATGGSTYPPMGQRFRLKASYAIPTSFTPEAQKILRALKKYGAIIADTGSSWFITGTTDTRWPDATFDELKTLHGSDFEAVQGASLQVAPNSYAAKNAPMAQDWNADVKPDLIWRSSTSGNAYVWYMNGATLITDAFLTGVDPSWRLEGLADFNGDGNTDLVWRNTTSGATWVWYMNGTTFVSDAFLFSLPTEWKIEGVADFNHDGKPDFLMRNTTTGLAFVWYFNDATPIVDQYLFTIDPSWIVEAVADFDLDGQPDLFFRNTASGLAFVWYTASSGGTTSLGGSSPSMFSISTTWAVVQVADWNGDGKPDLLFWNSASGVVFAWYLDGTTLGASQFITQISPPWELVPRH